MCVCSTAGNPGCADFYEAYARELWVHYDRRVHVWVQGHVGHSKRSAAAHPHRLFTLEDQVETQLSVARMLLSPDGPVAGGDPTNPKRVQLALAGVCACGCAAA